MTTHAHSSKPDDTNDDWYFAMSEPNREMLRKILWRYLRADNEPPTRQQLVEVMGWQQLENDVMTDYLNWLERAKAYFDRRGIAWTTTNINRSQRLWAHE